LQTVNERCLQAHGGLALPIVRMSADTADEPAEAQRDNHRGIRPTFDSVAQKFFQWCSGEGRSRGVVWAAHMPLSPEQEALCERLEKGEGTPNAATLIRQQAREIDDLWDRLSRAYALIRQESPAEMIQD
jgi:hypothetical protein